MASYSNSVWSGDVPWHMRDNNDPYHRPFGAFANCKPMAPPVWPYGKHVETRWEREERELEKFCEERHASALRWEAKLEELWKQEKDHPVIDRRHETKFAMWWRETGDKIRVKREQYAALKQQIREDYKRLAFKLDGYHYWGMRYYRESVWPEILLLVWYLFLFLLVVVAACYIYKLKARESRGVCCHPSW